MRAPIVVGYGDITPHTVLGRVLACFIMIMGYGIIAVPTGIFSVELHHAVEAGRDRGEYLFDDPARRRLDEFVGVERKRPIGARRFERGAHSARGDSRLVDAGARIALDCQRQAFGDQRGQDGGGRIGRSMVDHEHRVQHAQVVANECFDDIRLVADHGDADEFHARAREAAGTSGVARFYRPRTRLRIR